MCVVSVICIVSVICVVTVMYDIQMQPLDEQEKPVSQGTYVRSGLLGFVGEGGLVFICGTMDGLINIVGRRHNTEDLIATVMAVEPHNFVYKGR